MPACASAGWPRARLRRCLTLYPLLRWLLPAGWPALLLVRGHSNGRESAGHGLHRLGFRKDERYGKKSLQSLQGRKRGEGL